MSAVRGRSLMILASSLAICGGAWAKDPVLKAGRDPSGTAIAAIADGFDYTRVDIAKVLARDGEGEAIAWDAVDGDHRPFASDGTGTEAVASATARGGIRAVIIRVAPQDPASLAQGIGFAMSTPAKIVLSPLSAQNRSRLEVLKAAADRFSEALFLSSAPSLTDDEKKTGESLPNLLLLDSKDDELVAAKAIARALGRGQAPLAGSTGAELKTAFLARLEAQPPAGCEPESARKPN